MISPPTLGQLHQQGGIAARTASHLLKLQLLTARCPICNHARAHPESWLGRVLHHPLHADHCPFWKAERDVAAERKADAE